MATTTSMTATTRATAAMSMVLREFMSTTIEPSTLMPVLGSPAAL